MANSSEESVNRNSLFARSAPAALAKPGISPEFVHDQLALIVGLAGKINKAATINPDFEPTKQGSQTLKECISIVGSVLKGVNPELAKDTALIIEEGSDLGNSNRSSFTR